MSITVVGSSAFDDIETPRGSRKGIIGGSCIYFSLAASFKAKSNIVSVVGKDFPKKFGAKYSPTLDTMPTKLCHHPQRSPLYEQPKILKLPQLTMCLIELYLRTSYKEIFLL